LCQARDIVDQTEIEADVYVLSGYILRFCPRCGTSTEWRRAVTQATAQPAMNGEPTTQSTPETPSDELIAVVGPEPASFYSNAAPELIDTSPSSVRLTAHLTPVQVATPESTPREALPVAATAVVARAANRRRDIRTRVSFTACVRQENAGDDIVECDNISKGGLLFRSRKSYAVGSCIKVAVPYSPGAHAIFVVACICHVETIASGSLFRYGAA
jgi:hypothetical protein